MKPMDIKDIDFSKYEGMILDWYNGDEFACEVKVVGFDYDIGITIVEKDDESNHMACLAGPSSPINDDYIPDEYIVMYTNMFTNLIQMIEKNRKRVDVKKLRECSYGVGSLYVGNHPTAESCSFNQ